MNEAEFILHNNIEKYMDIPDYTDPPKSGLKNSLGMLTFRRMLTPLQRKIDVNSRAC